MITPVSMGLDITAVKIDNNNLTVFPVKKLERLEDKYYLVQNNNVHGIYHRDFGFSSEFDNI